MTWEEEIDLLLHGYGLGGSAYLLLADSAGYYFYDFDTDNLWRAGTSLAEVHLGIREGQWWHESKDGWKIMGKSMTVLIISLVRWGE